MIWQYNVDWITLVRYKIKHRTISRQDTEHLNPNSNLYYFRYSLQCFMNPFIGIRFQIQKSVIPETAYELARIQIGATILHLSIPIVFLTNY